MEMMDYLFYLQIPIVPPAGMVPYSLPPKFNPRHNDDLGKVALLFGMFGILCSPIISSMAGPLFGQMTWGLCLMSPFLAWTSLILGLLASFRGSKWGYLALIFGIINVFLTSWFIYAMLNAPGV